MACISPVPGVIVCTSGPNQYRRRIERCPFCQCMTEFVYAYPASPYYGPDATCTKCGDRWADEGRYQRPFARDWRRRAAKQARANWAVATYGPPPSYKEWFEDDPFTTVDLPPETGGAS